MKRLFLALMLLTTVAWASAPSARHLAWCRAAVASLPRFNEDADTEAKRAELDRIAAAVAVVSISAPLPPREWASAVLTVWKHESGLSSRIIAGNCKPHECDSGKARGGGQVHRNSLNAADWDAALGNIELQVKLTDDALRRGYNTCARSGVDSFTGTINGYAGRRCGDMWPGLEQRMATWSKLVRVDALKGATSS